MSTKTLSPEAIARGRAATDLEERVVRAIQRFQVDRLRGHWAQARAELRAADAALAELEKMERGTKGDGT